MAESDEVQESSHFARFDAPQLSPTEFERWVETNLRAQGVGLRDFKVAHLERLAGSDGDYEIDVTARFEALGGDFLVLIECKHQKHPIKRDPVQLIADKVRSIGAQKGMLFATAPFQRGALQYARLHGIALVRVADGRTSFETKSSELPRSYPSGLPRFVGWLTQINERGNVAFAYFGEVDIQNLVEAFACRAV